MELAVQDKNKQTLTPVQEVQRVEERKKKDDNKESIIARELAKGNSPQEIATKHHISILQIAKVKNKLQLQKESLAGRENVAAAFQLFKKGTKLEDVVIKLRLEPEKVMEIWNSYEKLSGHNNPICSTSYEAAYERLKEEVGTVNRVCLRCGRPMKVHLYDPSVRKLLSSYGPPYAHRDCVQQKGYEIYTPSRA